MGIEKEHIVEKGLVVGLLGQRSAFPLSTKGSQLRKMIIGQWQDTLWVYIYIYRKIGIEHRWIIVVIDDWYDKKNYK